MSLEDQIKVHPARSLVACSVGPDDDLIVKRYLWDRGLVAVDRVLMSEIASVATTITSFEGEKIIAVYDAATDRYGPKKRDL